MTALELITDRVPSLKSSDVAGVALDWMSEFKVQQLPIVDEGKYIGLISEENILDTPEVAAQVGDIAFVGWNSAYILAGSHIYDVLDTMVELGLDLAPVIDEERNYLGAITLRDLGQYLLNLFALREPGGILVIEIAARSYTLAEIGRITESADVQVLSLYLSRIPDSPNMLLTLKLNVEDLSRVIAAFERFNYTVVRAIQRMRMESDFSRNYDALFRYLNT